MRLMIYEDNALLRDSLLLMLSTLPDIEIVGTFTNCDTVQADIAKYKPEVVLMDIDMPGKNGIYGAEQIKIIDANINVIMHTVFDDDDKIFKSLEAGADGYLLKSTSPAKLYEAIKDVILGSAPMSPGIARKVLKSFHHKPAPPQYDLSKREIEILHLLVEGYSYKKIASECFISLDTVRSHLKNIYGKLHVNSGKEAVAKAIRDRIVLEK